MSAVTDRLLAAADLLDKRAGEAAPGPWPVDSDNHLGLATVSMPYMVGPVRDTDRRFSANFPDDATAHYIATMHPEVGKAIAAWLRAEAARVLNGPVVFGGTRALFTPSPEALALADLLAAEAS